MNLKNIKKIKKNIKINYKKELVKYIIDLRDKLLYIL